MVLILCRFYGINLNQNVVLQQIGFAGTTGTAWQKLYNIATGNIIITALGFVPGQSYHRTPLPLLTRHQVITLPSLLLRFSDESGSRSKASCLQLSSVRPCTTNIERPPNCYASVAILAGLFHKLSHAAFVVNFALLQVCLVSVNVPHQPLIVSLVLLQFRCKHVRRFH
jgi:MFS transporter, PHS family, inorganic phosphate transporter